jgi:hypothetical protein
MRLIKNEVILDGWCKFLLPVVALPLVVLPWWKCHAVFDRLFSGWGGVIVYAGSHHLAVIHKNIRVLYIRDKKYC